MNPLESWLKNTGSHQHTGRLLETAAPFQGDGMIEGRGKIARRQGQGSSVPQNSLVEPGRVERPFGQQTSHQSNSFLGFILSRLAKQSVPITNQSILMPAKRVSNLSAVQMIGSRSRIDGNGFLDPSQAFRHPAGLSQ